MAERIIAGIIQEVYKELIQENLDLKLRVKFLEGQEKIKMGWSFWELYPFVLIMGSLIVLTIIHIIILFNGGW